MALFSYFPLFFLTAYVQLILISTVPYSSALPISDSASRISSKRFSASSLTPPETLVPLVRQVQDESSLDAALEADEVYGYVLRGGSHNAIVSVTAPIPETADHSKIHAIYNVTKGPRVLSRVNNKTGAITQESFYLADVNLVFTHFPGEAHLLVTVTDGLDFRFERFYMFHVLGAVIYDISQNDSDDGITLYTGRNANALRLEIPDETASVLVKKYNASLYNGSPGWSNPLLNSELSFSVPDKSPLKWNSTMCDVFAEEKDLSYECSFAFSTDYSQFMVRTAHDVIIEDDLKDADRTIGVIWEGIQSVEQEVGVNTADKYEQNDIVNVLRIDGTGDGLNNIIANKGGAVPTVVIVITPILVTLALFSLVCCWCVWGRTRNMRLEAKVRAWVNGDISSLRTTAGRTVGVLEDPLSGGDAALMAAEKNAALMRQEYVRGGMESTPGGSAAESELHTFAVEETDGTDGLVPLDRLGEDKSVTKLVLPRGRGMRRGVSLEGSTDGGSAVMGRASASTDADGREDSGSSGRRRDTGYSGQNGSTETGQELSTEATTEPTGTVIVDDGRGDSINRDGVEAAIDRVRQVDLLLGPASRGLVGRNGEPILGSGSLEDVDAMSKKGPDSGIVTLSTLS